MITFFSWIGIFLFGFITSFLILEYIGKVMTNYRLAAIIVLIFNWIISTTFIMYLLEILGEIKK